MTPACFTQFCYLFSFLNFKRNVHYAYKSENDKSTSRIVHIIARMIKNNAGAYIHIELPQLLVVFWEPL